MSFAQPRQEWWRNPVLPAGIALIIIGAIWYANMPHGPGWAPEPIPGVPPTPYPVPGEDGYKLPGEDRPPVDEGPKEPTYH